MKNLTSPLLFIIIILSFSCHGNKPVSISPKDSLAIARVSLLDDNNFQYINLINTNDLRYTDRRSDTGKMFGNLYTDSTFKKTFVQLTPDQKELVLAPFMAQVLEVNKKYVREWMQAYFIAKQDKIGEFQPIIVHVSGDDYGSLTMIILDKNNNYVSGYNIEAGMEGGPEEIGDSLIRYDKDSYSRLERNLITTTRIQQTDHTDSTKKAKIIDSAVFVSTIDKTGKIVTKQTVKAHFVKP